MLSLLEYYKQKKVEIETTFSDAMKGTADQRRILEEEAEKQHRANLTGIREAAAAKDLAKAKQTSDALKSTVSAGIVSTVQNMTLALKKGENVFSAFAQGVASLIGDIAIQMGSIFIATGVAQSALFSNPGTGTILAGIALVAAGTLFKAAFGGGGASAPTAASSSGGGLPGGSSSPVSGDDLNKVIEEKQTNVKIDVGGTVLDPIGVGQQIAQILNDTFSATGTKVVTA